MNVLYGLLSPFYDSLAGSTLKTEKKILEAPLPHHAYDFQSFFIFLQYSVSLFPFFHHLPQLKEKRILVYYLCSLAPCVFRVLLSFLGFLFRFYDIYCHAVLSFLTLLTRRYLLSSTSFCCSSRLLNFLVPVLVIHLLFYFGSYLSFITQLCLPHNQPCVVFQSPLVPCSLHIIVFVQSACIAYLFGFIVLLPVCSCAYSNSFVGHFCLFSLKLTVCRLWQSYIYTLYVLCLESPFISLWKTKDRWSDLLKYVQT